MNELAQDPRLRAMHLNHELRAIRNYSQTLALGDIKRWRYSLRAIEITEELAKIAAQRKAP